MLVLVLALAVMLMVDGYGCGCRMIFYCQTFCSHFQVSGHEISGNIQNFGFPRHQLQ